MTRPQLDRRVYFDERSRDYPVRRLLSGTRPRTKQIWEPRHAPLDQGAEGACVGFAWAGELAATPHRYSLDDTAARELYQAARAQDRAMGNLWDEGASVLAGAKACTETGRITEYRWAFGTDEVIDALVQKGPAVLGIAWYDGMYETGGGGLVEISGRCVGGHAIMAHGYWPGHPDFGDVIVWTNSWGPGYGINGVGYLCVDDLDRLLSAQGEACLPVDAPVPAT